MRRTSRPGPGFLLTTTCSHHTAGDDLLSRIVNAAIGFKPLFALMKVRYSRRQPGCPVKQCSLVARRRLRRC